MVATTPFPFSKVQHPQAPQHGAPGRRGLGQTANRRAGRIGNPLVRFCEGREFNGDMEEILWHGRETRRQTEKTNLLLQSLETPVYESQTNGLEPPISM